MAPPKNPLVKTYLYRITNQLNGNDYVGIATDYKDRWREHVWVASRPHDPKECLLSTAIRKYGKENFEFKVISIARTWAIAQDLERVARRLGFGGYNRTMGGDGILGWHHSEETKAKIGKANKGRKPVITPESKAKQVATLAITNALPETKMRRAAAGKKIWQLEGYREKFLASSAVTNATPESRQRRRDGQLARWEAEPEARLVRGAKVRETHSRPEVKIAISEGTKAACARPEVKANKSKASSARWQKVRELGLKSLAQLKQYEDNLKQTQTTQ